MGNGPVNLVDPHGLDPSLGRLFLGNVLRNGASDAGRFVGRIGSTFLSSWAVLPERAYRWNTDPLGYLRDQHDAVAGAAAWLGWLSADGCARRQLAERLQAYAVTPEGIADATLLAEAVVGLAGPRLITPRGATQPTGQFYSTAFEVRLSPSSYPGVSRGRHFQEANESLLRAMEADAGLAQAMQQGGIILRRTATGLAPRTPPSGWTWHHAQETGVMQLVPRAQHAPGSIFQDSLHPGGQGGYSTWGQQNETH